MASINRTRLSYWFAKTAKPFMGEYQKPPSIHAVINSKVTGPGVGNEMNNTLNRIRLRRKAKKPIDDCFAPLGPSTASAAILNRWRRNLERSRKR